MRRILLAFTAFLLIGIPFANAQTYVFSYVPNGGNPGGLNTETSDASTTSWTSLVAGNQATNIWSASTPIGFPFDFFGVPVTNFKVSQNLVLTFDVAAVAVPGANGPLPSASLPDLSIAGFWDAFTNAPNTGSNDVIYTRTFGTAPNRQLWIKWFSFEVGSPNLSFVYNSIVLEETSNKIYLVDMYNIASTTSNLTSTVGVQQNIGNAVTAGSNILLGINPGTSPADNDYYAFSPVVSANDIFASRVLASAVAKKGCGTNLEPIKVTFQNLGFNVASNVSVSYSVDGGAYTTPETVAGPVSTGDTLQYTFTALADLSAPGAHIIKAVATVTGDASALNDTVSTTITTVGPTTLPLNPVSFTGFTGSNLATVAPGWTEAAGQGTPVGTTSIWTSDDFGNVVGGPNGISARIELYLASRREWILSPKFTAAANTQLDFDLALTFWSTTASTTLGSDDSLWVGVSTDCGNTFARLLTYTAANSISATGQHEVLSLSAYAGQDIIVGFYATDGTVDDVIDNNVYIDNIRILNIFPNDVNALSASTSAVAGQGCGTSVEPVTVNIQNDGSLAASNITTSFSVDGGPFSTPEIIAGPIASGTQTLYTFTATADLSAFGPHTITVVATVAGDGVSANDTAEFTITTVAPISLPLPTVTFAGFTGSNLPAVTQGWNEGKGIGTPAIIASAWTGNNFGNQAGGGVNGTAGRINLYTTGKNDWILSPKFTASVNTELFFDLAVTNYLGTNAINFGSDDKLQVMVSSDCGTTFTPIATFNSTTPVSNTGQSQNYILGAYAGQDIIVGFFASEGTIDDLEDYDVFIDNIQLRNVFPQDMVPTAVTAPVSGCGLSASETVTVSVLNQGTATVDSFFVSFSVDGGAFTAPQSFNIALASGGTGSYTLTAGADLSAVGSHTIVVVATGAGEDNTLNDTLSYTVDNIPVVSSFPYFENFESGRGGWTAGGTSSTWAFGTPAKTVIQGAGSGVNAWVTGGLAGGTYNPSENSQVTSPCFDFTNAPAGMYVAFKVWWHSEFSWDGTVLQSSIDNGATWQNVGAFGDPTNWYNDTTINGNPGGQQDGWTGTAPGSGGWVTASHTLDGSLVGQSSVRLRVAFGSDTSFQFDGFAFDDFGIGLAPVVNLGTDSLTYCIGTALDAGNAGATFAWSTGDTTQTLALDNNSGGFISDSVISVLVTNTIGLTARDTILVSIVELTPSTTASVVSDASCYGFADGSALAVGSGNGAVSYLWSTTPVQDSAVAIGLGIGTYTVSLIDAFGCTAIDSVTITQPDTLALSVVGVDNSLCFGDSAGAIIVGVSGGTMPYSYLWSNGDTTSALANIPAGSYVGTITDANGCVFVSDSVAVTQPEVLAVALDSLVDADCFNGANGSIAISVTGGTGAYSFVWSSGDTTQNVSGLAPGEYTGTITDANGCALVSPTLTVGYMDTLPDPSFTFVVGGGRVEFTNTSVGGSSYAWNFGDGVGTDTTANPVYVYTANASYIVTLTVTNGCGSSTDTITLEMSTVSVDQLLASKISIYPNPTQSAVQVNFDQIQANELTIVVFNVHGQRIQTIDMGRLNGSFVQEIDLSGVANGTYLIQVIADGASATKQVIKQ